MRTIGHKLLLEVIPWEEYTTNHGLVIPNFIHPKYRQAKVISVGGDVTIDVKVGDVVIIPPMAGDTIEYNDRIYLSLHEDHVWAKMEK